MISESLVSQSNPYPGKGELSIMYAGHSQTFPQHKVLPKVHDYHLVHYVVSGKGMFQCSGHTYHLQCGSSFFIFPGELVSYGADNQEPWFYRFIGFKGSHADEILNNIGITPLTPIAYAERNRRVPAMFAQIERILHDNEPNCDLRSGGMMRMLLAEFMKENHTNPTKEDSEVSEIKQRVEQAIRRMTLQYYEPISIEEMAQTLGYHRTHFSKMFKIYTGLSPMHFLLNIRMDRAKSLLWNGSLTIEQVASSVGYSDALYFSRHFHKYTGVSPTTYRERQKK